MTSLPCNTVWKYVQVSYLHAVFSRNFRRGRLHPPPPFVVGEEERGENLLPILSTSSDGAKETCVTLIKKPLDLIYYPSKDDKGMHENSECFFYAVKYVTPK